MSFMLDKHAKPVYKALTNSIILMMFRILSKREGYEKHRTPRSGRMSLPVLETTPLFAGMRLNPGVDRSRLSNSEANEEAVGSTVAP
jgi:hypothetical protein